MKKYNGFIGYLLTLSFECTVALLRLHCLIPLIGLRRVKGLTEMPSPHRCSGEPSLSQRRRLDDSMPSLRQLVELKGTLHFIPTCASDNPLRQSPPAPPKGRETIWMEKLTPMPTQRAYVPLSLFPCCKAIFLPSTKLTSSNTKNGVRLVVKLQFC